MSDVPTPNFKAPVIGRPVEYSARVNTGLRLPIELHDALKAAAAERGVSANLLAERGIADYLSRLIPLDEMKWTR